MSQLVYQSEHLYKFVLGGELYTFTAKGWDEISVKFAQKFPQFELRMHDECNECSEDHDCPDRAKVHGLFEITDLLQLNFEKISHKEHWMWVS